MAESEKSRDQLLAEVADLRQEVAELQTRQERLLAALAASQRQLRSLFEAIPVGVVGVDRSGKIEIVNTRLEEQFGYQREALIGQPLSILIPERYHTPHEPHFSDYFTQAQIRPMGIGLDLVGRRRDGSEFPIEIGLGFWHDTLHPLALAFVVDITQRKQTEKQMRTLAVEQEQHRVLRQFVQELAHDFKMPLSVILSTLYLLVK